MLDLQPKDILDLVFFRLTNPNDYFNVYSTCKTFNIHLKTVATHAQVKIMNGNTSIIFFGEMNALIYIKIYRKYNTFLDFSPLSKISSLRLIYTNSPTRISNIPCGVRILYGHDKLYKYITHYSSSLLDFPEEPDIDDDDFLNVKEYFCQRYERKYRNFTRAKCVSLSSSI